MQWHSWAEFWAMGGYGFYVWGSFGVTALVIVAEIWQVRAQRRALLRNLLNETNSQDDIHSSPSS
ncbi:heme exporter protein CcmD [Rhodoferax sp. U2-2l]|uniref:heme exporter protein CcmD n=1 Tax=Rhodoferax sp. U2-2l TaxID=2884000 RepID=UPI001D09D4D0|nr:heme exporter protein CcmD [Rhodoferax sp. U2-2l]MCB8746366.1 heme exporter protein CcmD [Rhodoferax sp. U2-2l]